MSDTVVCDILFRGKYVQREVLAQLFQEVEKQSSTDRLGRRSEAVTEQHWYVRFTLEGRQPLEIEPEPYEIVIDGTVRGQMVMQTPKVWNETNPDPIDRFFTDYHFDGVGELNFIATV